MKRVMFVSVLAAGFGAAQLAYAQSPAPTSLTTRALELIATMEAESAAAGGTTLSALLGTTSRPEFVAFGRRVEASELPRIDFSRARTIHLIPGPDPEIRIFDDVPAPAVAEAIVLRVVSSTPGSGGRTDLMVVVDSTLMTHEEFTQMRAGIPDYDAGIAEVRIVAGGALARVIGASPVATLIHVVRRQEGYR